MIDFQPITILMFLIRQVIWEPFHTSKEVQLLARLLREEAKGDGKLGMLMVGNVGGNWMCSMSRFQGYYITHQNGFKSQADLKQHKRAIFIRMLDKLTMKSLWFFRPSGDCPGP